MSANRELRAPTPYSAFETRRGLVAAYNEAPVDDADRTETEANFGREVLTELPMPWPYKTTEDWSHRVALRVVHSDEVTLELGAYDFGPIDVEMLRQAINAYDLAVRGSATMPPLSPESLHERLMAYDGTPIGEGNE